MQQNPLPSSVTGIDSLIHAAGHPLRPLASGLPSTNLAPLLDDVRDAMVAIYCDHDAQAAHRIEHARSLLRDQSGSSMAAWSLLEEAAFHLRLHHPWSALSALRQAGDALLMVRLDGGSA
ncbi:MAG TPA: hypothetical protein VLG41_10230 [Hydrogenophaga sp.]|uniref:hypothetical protein n=1 Tax=Hydrogenophaga sp. TaxID=1904254 RepID=UPI002B6AEE3C|nr:hypothetical protein [Hydrogenophaga sp.]HSX93287.1 hypothetical protein [Hydrogenophaga sp.]